MRGKGSLVETITCALCDKDPQELVWKGHDWAYGEPGEFSMVRCAECGLLMLNPRPTADEMSAYYPQEYEPYLRTRSALRSQLSDLVLRLKLRARVGFVRDFGSQGDLLDVGCGSGGFLRQVSQLGGWRVKGVELNPSVAQFVRERLGLDVFSGEVMDAGFADNSFDIVTMWDVLEHVRDPLRVLGEVRRILRPGGLFLCSTPNAESVDARLFGRYWIGYDIPRHLYVFSTSTLDRLLTQAGLHVERFFCFYGRYTTFALSVSLWINAHISSSSLKHTCRSVLLFPLFRYLTLPYFYLLDKLRVGAILTVRARKPT